MRLLPFFLLAVVAIAVSRNENVNLDEATDLIQEHAMLETGAKTNAKVSAKTAVKSADAVKATTSAKAKAASKEETQIKARATVMIGTHELDAEEVTMAKAQLHKVVRKMGSRHPEFLGEAAQISSMAGQGAEAGYVAGGYIRLKKILEKVDTFEKELRKEHYDLDINRNLKIRKCNSEGDNLSKGMAKFAQDSKTAMDNQKRIQGNINKRMTETEKSKARENGQGMEVTMGKTVIDSKNDYDKYWAETEERHQVRNVLMQALWLVCTGFRKFRHTAYCTTLRKQPDYAETGDSKWVDEGGNDYATNLRNTIKFGETMSPVWEQQKVADAEAANQLDGDVDMEKGFVNNRAPWGVDPAASGGEEEKEMTSEQMSSRLSFLIETSYTPERIASPISGFISALQEGDEATQQSLVHALVDIDRQEGESQSALDAEWYADMVAGIKTTNTAADSQDFEFKTQADLHKANVNAHARMVANQVLFERLENTQEDTVEEGVIAAAQCEVDLVELEATLEVNEEELVNIMRLNSLLRYLVIGEKPACSDCKDENRGSCTWVTRGAEAKGADADASNTNCKDLAGNAVECNYANSQHASDYAQRSDVFCACEYGYYGNREARSPSGVQISQSCPHKKCPGFGRIKYTHDGSALAVTAFPAIARCSSRHGVTHGLCDPVEGLCTDCCVQVVNGECKGKTPLNVQTAVMRESYPYHGEQKKCEHWMCPIKEQVHKSETFYYRPPGSSGEPTCMGHGSCHHNKYGQSTGRCICTEPWYGKACHLRKCQAREGVYFKATSPNVCNGKGMCLNQEDDQTTGLAMGSCKCSERFHGDYCELKRCPGFDKALAAKGEGDGSCPDGTCDSATGACECNTGGTACGRGKDDQCPTGCTFKACSQECGNNGRCDRISGECTCAPNVILNGPTCKAPKRCDEKEADWSQSFDRWGWSTCKHGYLLVGLKTDQQGSADALYNLNKAVCAKPCEGAASEVIKIERYACYHENWWKKFDTAGGKYCRRNYFVAGLFRSHCNSLYCIEMAKCCQVKRSLWTACKWSAKGGWTERANGIKADNNDGFVVGFWRDGKHTLNGITQLRICTPIWWGLFDPSAAR